MNRKVGWVGCSTPRLGKAALLAPLAPSRVEPL